MKNKKVAETLKFKSNLSELNYINVSWACLKEKKREGRNILK